jgi:hypothetical protein
MIPTWRPGQPTDLWWWRNVWMLRPVELTVARRVVLRPEAEDDALDVRRWYESRREGLGRESGAAVDARQDPSLAESIVKGKNAVMDECSSGRSKVYIRTRQSGDDDAVVVGWQASCSIARGTAFDVNPRGQESGASDSGKPNAIRPRVNIAAFKRLG